MRIYIIKPEQSVFWSISFLNFPGSFVRLVWKENLIVMTKYFTLGENTGKIIFKSEKTTNINLEITSHSQPWLEKFNSLKSKVVLFTFMKLKLKDDTF